MDNEKKIEHFGPADTPFDVQDGHLAFALYLAGVPFYHDPTWCRNLYTPELLERLGFKGMDAREAAREAVRTNKRGMVRFFFRRIGILHKLLALFTKQERELDSAEGLARDLYKDILVKYKAGKMSDEEAAIRVACVVLKMRVKFMNGWKEVCPRIRLLNTGPTTRRNFPFRDSEGRAGVGTLVGMPGYKEFSADTSDERLKDMGVL